MIKKKGVQQNNLRSHDGWVEDPSIKMATEIHHNLQNIVVGDCGDDIMVGNCGEDIVVASTRQEGMIPYR